MRIDDELLAKATKLFVVNFPPLDKVKDSEFTRGIQLFRENTAIISSYNGSHVYGVVHDEDGLFDVSIHLSHPDENNCTCNLLGQCEHIVALFAKFYTEKHPLKKLLQDRLQHTLLASKQITKASAIVAKKEEVLQIDPMKWWEHLEKEFKHFKEERRRSFLYSDYLLLNDIVELFHPRMIRGQKDQKWYCAYVTFFCFHELMLQLENHHVLNTFQEKNILPLVDKLLADFLDYADEAMLTEDTCPFRKDLNEKLLSLLLMISKYRFPVFSLLYLWTKSTLSKKDCLEYLKKYKQIRGASAHILRGLLQFHLGKDSAVVDELSQLEHVEELDYYYFLAESFVYDQNTEERFQIYINSYKKALIEHLKETISNSTRTSLVQKYLQLFFMSEEDEQAREQEIHFFMPYSFSILADRLVSQGKYNEWAELLLLLDFDLDELPLDIKKMAEEQFPESMLPFYFRQVEEFIAKKNRQSYKDAVRAMKRMKKLYRSMKDLPTFESYIAHIVSKTKRMKAFQEELEKGRII